MDVRAMLRWGMLEYTIFVRKIPRAGNGNRTPGVDQALLEGAAPGSQSGGRAIALAAAALCGRPQARAAPMARE